LGSRCRLEIDVGAMVQVVTATWASDSDKRPARTWVEQLFARSLEELKVMYKNLSSCTEIGCLIAYDDERSVNETVLDAEMEARRVEMEA
jgi:hypothetical protein